MRVSTPAIRKNDWRDTLFHNGTITSLGSKQALSMLLFSSS